MTFDVAARLADARPAIDNTQAYVSACRAVGYQHPDLTAHGAQITEWFASDDGLDLNALDADCADLQRAIATVEAAVKLEHDAHGSLTTAWVGASGSAAADFTERHCRTGKVVLALLHAAVETCATLRDNLWRGVDAKVDAAITIDERRAGERGAWLAASHSTVTGGPDRSTAVELVEKAVVPYVDSDIRTEWVGAMRSAAASAATAYGDAINQVRPSTTTDFEVPTQLMPAARTQQWLPEPASQREFRPEPVSDTTVAPAAREVAASLPVPEPQVGHLAAPSTEALPVSDPLAPAVPPAMGPPPSAATSPAGLSGGLPAPSDFGGGLPGLFDGEAAPPRWPDNTDTDTGIGPDHGEPDRGEVEEDSLGDADEDAVDDSTDEPEAEPEDEAEVSVPESNSVDPVPALEVESPADRTDEPVMQPATPVPPLEAPQALGNSDELTPCEIAADELPQVGQ